MEDNELGGEKRTMKGLCHTRLLMFLGMTIRLEALLFILRDKSHKVGPQIGSNMSWLDQ